MPDAKDIAGKTAAVLRAASGTDKKRATAAIVLAAGSSSRMGGDVRKQFLTVGGIPVVVRTLLAFEAADCIDEIVVVAGKDDAEVYRNFKKKYGIGKLKRVVTGGETRQESALLGFTSVDRNDVQIRYVAIADAARCLITPEQIGQVCLAAYRSGAATAAWHPHDSVKLTDKKDGRGALVTGESLDRDRVWLAQTPQVFSRDLYAAAAYSARENGFSATDDCALVEKIGRKITLVDCGQDNVKITEPGDIARAEMILRIREVAK